MGVTLFRLDSGERVTAVFLVVEDDAPEESAAPDTATNDIGPGETPADEGDDKNG